MTIPSTIRHGYPMTAAILTGKVFLLLSAAFMCAPVAMAQAVTTPVTAGPGAVVTIPTGTTVNVASGTAISSTGGSISGTDIRAIVDGSGTAVKASGSGALITLDGTSVISAGNGSYLVEALAGGRIVLGNTQVSGPGASVAQAGLHASGAGSSIAVATGTISSARGGAWMDNGGQISLGAGTVINLSGSENGSAGLLVNNIVVPDGAIASGLTVNINNGMGVARTTDYAWIGVSMQGDNARLSLDRLTVQGNDANIGVFVADYGVLNLTNSNIVVNGHGGNSNDAVRFWPININMFGSQEYGIILYNGGTLNASNTSVTVNTTGASVGIEAYNQNTLNLDHVSINMAGTGGGSALYIYQSSVAHVTNSIITTGNAAYAGVRVLGNSTFVGDAMAITTNGAASYGVRVTVAPATATLTNSTITTNGATSSGVWVNGVNAKFTGDTLLITTNGDTSYGVYVQAGGVATVSNSQIDVNGSGSAGLRLLSGAMYVDTVDVSAMGAGSTGIQLTDSSIAILNSNIEASGSGVVEEGNAPHFAMTGGSITSAATAFRVTATNAVLNIGDVKVTGNGLLLDVADAASVTLLATGSTLTGDMQAAGSGAATVALSDGSNWTGAARNPGSLSLTDSIWNLTGNSDVASLVLGNTTVAFSSPDVSGYKTLTVRGNYTGADALFVLNTRLGDDSSPTDRLVIQGDTAGSSQLRIVNNGGLGAMTVSDGIQVVQVQGTSAGAFALNGRVAAGAYEYTLRQGGNAATGGNADDGNWYLRSIYTPPDVPVPPTPPVPPVPQLPDIRVEVPVDMVIPVLATEYGYAMLGTLHERVGEDWVRQGADGQRFVAGSWGRIIGERGFRDGNNFFSSGPRFSYDFAAVQAGLDVFARQAPDGTRDRAGFYVGYGQIDSNVKAVYGGRAGTVDMDAYTLGLYWTHYATSGWYTDAILQGTQYSATAKSIENQRITPDGLGLIGSLEGGYSFRLGARTQLEPQAQIVYQTMSFDNAQDDFGRVSFNDTNSLRGRIGVRLAHTRNMAADGADPRLITAWVRTNVWHEFEGDSETTFSSLSGDNGTQFSTRFDGTWGEIGVGVTGQLTQSVSLFATAGYDHSTDFTAWNGRLGLTVKW